MLAHVFLLTYLITANGTPDAVVIQRNQEVYPTIEACREAGAELETGLKPLQKRLRVYDQSGAEVSWKCAEIDHNLILRP